MIVLDERLAAAAQLVRPGSRVADVGTDHGYLIARLLLDGKAVFGYACDIHPKPLEKAAETLKQYGLQDCSALFLGDGLQGLLAEQVDDVVIAGMGGDMILHILDTADWKNSSQRFVLQPMTKVHELRAGLYQRGYEILQERASICQRLRLCGDAGPLVWAAVRRYRFICPGGADAPNRVGRSADLSGEAGTDSKENCRRFEKIQYKAE